MRTRTIRRKKRNALNPSRLPAETGGDTVRRRKTFQPRANAITPALRIGSTGDPAEMEANRVARQVMGSGAVAVGNTAAPVIQRNSAGPGSASAGNVDTGTARQIQSMRGGGRALPAGERGFFESRFRRDFSDVRVHTGPGAGQLARKLDARAFTLGKDIVFGENAYQPGSPAGRELLAHELTHTLQQGAGDAGRIQRSGSGGGERDDSCKEKKNFSQKNTSLGDGQSVYVCSRPLGYFKYITPGHAFFRVGGAGAGHKTFSLFPFDKADCDCWQGEPVEDYTSDVVHENTWCRRVNLTADKAKNPVRSLRVAANSYPVGAYCDLGPNSNTFTAQMLKKLDPNTVAPGWLPGYTDKITKTGTVGKTKLAGFCNVEDACHVPTSRFYHVKAGDTLWSLAKDFYKDPYRWPEIHNANPDLAEPVYRGPGDIFVLLPIGKRLKIPLDK